MTPAVRVAFVGHKAAPVHAVEAKPWPELAELLTAHRPGEKDGPAWMPADIEPGPRKAERVRAVTALSLDVEARCEGSGAGKRVIGPLPPELRDVAAELRARGWQAALASTHSHREPLPAGGDLGPRYRVTLPLSRELKPAELRPLALHVARLLGLAECFDSSCAEPARLLYLPRHPPGRDTVAERATVEGEPLPVDALQEQAAALTAQPARPAAAASRPSVIDAFNAQADIPTMLERHGYKPAGGNRWLWPGSTSGAPGVLYLPDRERVFSGHAADPLQAGGRAHDAFGAWCALEHGGDERAAVRAAARLLGLERAPVGGEAGSKPRPLPPELLPVPPFPVEALPDTLRPWVADVAERMQCPPDFVAVPLIVGASLLAGRVARVRLRRRDDWTEPANLWAAIVGRPGMMKTPAMRAALAPLDELETAAREDFEAEAERYRVEALAAKLRGEALQAEAKKALRADRGADVSALLADAEEPEPAQRRRFMVNAPTWEKLHALLADNPGGLCMVRDELSGWLHDMGREEQAEARSFFVAAWSGGGFTVDRIGRGTVTALDMRLSVIGAIQPGPLAHVMRGRSGTRADDGLAERFLVAWPDDPGEWRDVDRTPNSTARDAVRAAFRRLDRTTWESVQAELPRHPDGTPAGAPFLRLDEGAREAFAEWHAELEGRLRAPNPDAAESALAKFRRHVPALALTLHLIDGGTGPVTEAAMLRALALGDYFESHARRMHCSATHGAVRAARAILARVRAGDLAAGFTAREVYRRGWSGLSEPELVNAALDLLALHGWLAETVTETGGRPATTYRLSEGARDEPLA
jgi:putative DNA primase/helicase